MSRAAVSAAVRAEEKQTQDYKLEQASPFGAMRLGASAVWTDPVPSQMNGLHYSAQHHVSPPRVALGLVKAASQRLSAGCRVSGWGYCPTVAIDKVIFRGEARQAFYKIRFRMSLE